MPSHQLKRTLLLRSRGPFLVLLAAVSLACNKDPVGVDDGERLPDADMRVLFIGNSLTYTNNLPAMVQTIAEATGHTMVFGIAAAPNVSLEDHWRNGVEGTILTVEADVVVMQQGPSSLPQNQDHLKYWADRLAGPIRQAGGEPALYMVWPDAGRTDAFNAVYEAYQEAAQEVNGLFMPAGLAWLHTWNQDPELDLYGPDGFHPSTLGSAVAALTIFRILFDQDVTLLPSRFEPTTSGLPTVDFGPNGDVIKQAVEIAVGGGPHEPGG